MSEALLATDGLTKHFGGVVASDRVTLHIPAGELHAVIGPNGAGKTTLIAQLSGELRPDFGKITIAGEDVTYSPAYHRALRGLARTFQITSIFKELTTLQNVVMAVQAHSGHSFHFWRPTSTDMKLCAPARRCLEEVGLIHREDIIAAHLSHGEKRTLEIAMALATRPRLLLLDEPMAGMGPVDFARMMRLIGGLKRNITILLVEHDMEAVFGLADRVTVLVNGRVIATGLPDEVRADDAVQEAYLGEEEAV